MSVYGELYEELKKKKKIVPTAATVRGAYVPAPAAPQAESKPVAAPAQPAAALPKVKTPSFYDNTTAVTVQSKAVQPAAQEKPLNQLLKNTFEKAAAKQQEKKTARLEAASLAAQQERQQLLADMRNVRSGDLSGLAAAGRNATGEALDQKGIFSKNTDYLTDAEKEMYYALVGQSVQNIDRDSLSYADRQRYDDIIRENAERYLAMLERDLASRQGKDLAAKANPDNVISMAALGMGQGASGFTQGMKQVTGGSDLHTSVIDTIRNMRNNTGESRGYTGRQQAYAKVRPEASKAAGVAGDLGSAMGFMAVPMMAAAAAAPMGGQGARAISSALMAAASGGQSYIDAMEQGYSKADSAHYGVASGILEGFGNYLLSGVWQGGKSLGNAALGKAIDKAAKALAATPAVKTALSALGSSGSEAVEEYLQAMGNDVLRNVTLGEENKIDPLNEEYLYSAFIGALLPAVMNAPMVAAEYRENKAEAAAVTYLSEKDIPGYLKAGNRQNKNRLKRYKSGQQIIISSDKEFDSFVRDSISGKRNLMVAYGRVDDTLAAQVKEISNSKVNIEGAYLELLSDDVYHTFHGHEKAKAPGDLDMSVDDLLYALKNVNKSEVVSVHRYDDGRRRIILAMPTNDGMVLLVEAASKSAGTLRLKTGWKVSLEKFTKKYGSNAPTAGSRSSIESVRDNIASNNIISQSARFDNKQILSSDGDLKHVMDVSNPLLHVRDEHTSQSAINNIISQPAVFGNSQNPANPNGASVSPLAADSGAASYFTAARGAEKGFPAPSRGGGLVLNMDKLTAATLTKTQRDTVKFLEHFAKASGFRIVVEESRKNADGKFIGANGWVDKDNVIHLDINAMRRNDKDTNEALVLYTLSHELTHLAERFSPDFYQKYSDFMFEVMSEQSGVPVGNLIKRQQELYAESRLSEMKAQNPQFSEEQLRALIEPLGEEAAFREVVAEGSQRCLTDSKLMERMVKQDASMAAKFRNWVLTLIARLKRAYREAGAVSPEMTAVERRMDEIAGLWEDMMMETSAAYQAADGVSENAGEQLQARLREHRLHFDTTVTPATRAESVAIDAISSENMVRYMKEVDSVLSGEMAAQQMVLLGRPSEVLQTYMKSSNPLYMPQSAIKKAVLPAGEKGGKHGLGKTVIYDLPYQFEDPLAITGNTTRHESFHDNSIVVWTDWMTAAGDSVIVPIRIDAEGYVGFYNNVNTAF